jgi:hypothetical protein
MENDFAPPDPPQPTPPATSRDPLIRYSVFAALGCAALCMVFTILYIFSYSLDSTLSFERHFDSYASGNTANLPTVLGLHMAQNRMFQQSCGMVAGIFFAFVGLALFFMGIQGTLDANGQVKDYAGSAKRLIPGGVILLASMIFVGVSAMHPIDFVLGPTVPATIIAPTAVAVPPVAAPLAPSSAPATQSELQPAPATTPTVHLAPQSAKMPLIPQASLLARSLAAAQPTAQSPAPSTAQPIPAIPPAQRPAVHLALVPVHQNAATAQHVPPQHRFQP